jgi:hypothetical protein
MDEQLVWDRLRFDFQVIALSGELVFFAGNNGKKCHLIFESLMDG